MGAGSWDTKSFAAYTTSTRGVSVNTFTTATNYTAQDIYKSRRLSDMLNPFNVMRECRDSDEHPQTMPVILGLDVTGSMGDASVRVAQKLNDIMTDLYEDNHIKDIEFCIMGIGDLAYDDAPVQISQFESDIRIAEQLDALYFEGGGGGNNYESYTAAWYMGLNCCDLDCWKRGKRGLIITLGDEGPNPYLPARIGEITKGSNLQSEVETKILLEEVLKKYDVYHISIKDQSSSYVYHQRNHDIDSKWENLLGEDNYFVCHLDSLPSVITNIVHAHALMQESNTISSTSTGEVSW